MAKVRERTGKNGVTSYYVRFRANGSETSEVFTTKAKAQWFARLVTDLGGTAARAHLNRRDKNHDDYVPTLAEYTDRHIRNLTGVEERTRIDYRRMAKRTWLATLGSYELDTITRDDIASWVNARDASAKTIANERALLSSVLADAVAEGIIDRNPAYKVRLPRSKEVERRDERYLTHREYADLIAAMSPEHRPLAILLFGTGLRWSEATALTVGDIHTHMNPPTLSVIKAWKVTPGKGVRIGPPKSKKSRRTVMLPRQVLEAIEPLMDGRAPGARLFTAQQGGRVHHSNWRIRAWLPAVNAAKIEPRPRIHDARHSHASWLIEQGATLEMVQDQLGHESILTTRKVYGHLQPAMRAQLAAMATAALEPPQPT